MGKIIRENVAWVLTFLGIITSIMTAAVLDIRADIKDLQRRVIVLEHKIQP